MAPELYRRTPVPLDRDNSPYGGASHNMPPSGQFFQRLLGGCEGLEIPPAAGLDHIGDHLESVSLFDRSEVGGVALITMTYRIQTFYPEANGFMNTNHTSESLEDLKALCESETFTGFRVRIVDDANHVVFEPASRERKGVPTIQDIAKMLNVPIRDKFEPRD